MWIQALNAGLWIQICMDPELLPGSESGVIVQQNMKGQINKNGK